MKNISILVLFMGTFFMSKTAVSATEVQSSDAHTEIGVVSVQGKMTLSEVSESLAKKADDEGASYYKIIAAGGNNKLFGVAQIYR
ncbi:Multiple stress resistance protein BhsA precursor [Yersinia frederiksenii]|uniref:Multiple stress resistance protein BhsA n=2 Tax=Yersinia frederiksenii TaxID=29484 RepID=A0A380PQ82_YERFR|nr:DUF1471 domain-containing protein [Yersinia frederiksenii]ATM95637.1 DUF1471 domain-containing protein [Yersinia frederiksenii]EEQ15137.1 hypothetical protein yfred0001_2440 [Yersinia frederiksenii ATCC 33641]KGA44800.1 hypothetical protein DJ58_3322 [Yersinia frederiksenii ATCC 33641]SUP75730.1 Multiple stress resistance protein BhsA precursor [Yersinia frederiksenii]